MNPLTRFKKLFIPLILIIIVAIIATICILPINKEKELRLGKVTRESLVQRATIAGNVVAIKTTSISAPYDGYIKKLYVKLGQHVKEGEPLVSVTQSLHASENVFPLRAPFDGTVVQLPKVEGQFVRASDTQEPILRLDDMSKLMVNANVPEIDLMKLKVGQEAVIKAQAVLSRTYKGVIQQIFLASTFKEAWGGKAQVEYLVKIEVTDKDEQLRPGMSTVVDVILKKKDNVLVVGHEFIHFENESYFVIMKNGEKRFIEVGIQNESVFEITKGLQEGDELQQVDFMQLSEDSSRS